MSSLHHGKRESRKRQVKLICLISKGTLILEKKLNGRRAIIAGWRKYTTMTTCVCAHKNLNKYKIDGCDNQ